jgi:hypothetical protein
MLEAIYAHFSDKNAHLLEDKKSVHLTDATFRISKSVEDIRKNTMLKATLVRTMGAMIIFDSVSAWSGLVHGYVLYKISYVDCGSLQTIRMPVTSLWLIYCLYGLQQLFNNGYMWDIQWIIYHFLLFLDTYYHIRYFNSSDITKKKVRTRLLNKLHLILPQVFPKPPLNKIRI